MMTVSKVLGAYGRDEVNNNGERLLTFVKRQQARSHEHVF